MGHSGKMIVFTAPSGAGKSTVVRHLLNKFSELAFSVSATTRPPRTGEENGKHYYFITSEDFQKRIDNGEFIEWEQVYPGLFYGTLKSEVERLWKEGKTIIFDIDVKGAQNLKRMYGKDCLTVFIKPPSLEILVDRLRQRGTDSEESLKKRVDRIREELSYENTFNRVLVNDMLEHTLREAEQIVQIFIPEIK